MFFRPAWSWTRSLARHLWDGLTELASESLSRQVLIQKVEGNFPAKLKSHILYILTEDGTPWQASMVCPCGCGKTLELNLLPDERPVWRYSTDRKGRVTLHPSIWRQVGCRSHFWLRRGKIHWVHASRY
jgi:hypothetical protein